MIDMIDPQAIGVVRAAASVSGIRPMAVAAATEPAQAEDSGVST
ncbi:MAG TPA: hypothetical protein VN043_06590 [Rhodanobacter sp.]|nr:hypothetical protein [Rhodanobacter sp.]